MFSAKTRGIVLARRVLMPPPVPEQVANVTIPIVEVPVVEEVPVVVVPVVEEEVPVVVDVPVVEEVAATTTCEMEPVIETFTSEGVSEDDEAPVLPGTVPARRRMMRRRRY